MMIPLGQIVTVDEDTSFGSFFHFSLFFFLMLGLSWKTGNLAGVALPSFLFTYFLSSFSYVFDVLY